MHITPTKYHSPAWSGEEGNRHYIVWGPGEILHDGIPCGGTRPDWAASWTSSNNGDFHRGSTIDEALSIFPAYIAGLFKKSILLDT